MSQNKVYYALETTINYWGYYLHYNNIQLSVLKTGTSYKRPYVHREKVVVLLAFLQLCNYWNYNL